MEALPPSTPGRDGARPRAGGALPSQLRALRILCVVCAALFPAFGLAYRHALPEAIDPLGPRLAFSALLLAVAAWTCVPPWSQRRLVAVGVALPHVACAWWIAAILFVNGFAPEYALGTLFIFLAGGLAIGMVADDLAPFLAFSALFVGGTAAALGLTERPGVDPVVLLTCLAGEAAVIAVVMAARTRAAAALTAAKEQAEEMARLKSAFLANMSHEIRTPLTAIIGFAEVLREEATEDHRELAGLIEKGGRRLMETLNSVLDLARLQSGGVALRLEAVDVAAEARDLAGVLRPLAARKGLLLDVHAPAHEAFALADRDAFRRVLTNLVGNAVKFTDCGGVAVSVEVREEDVLVAVSDTGRGIAPAFLPKLFDEFRQESSGIERSHEGSGLGLAITKGMVDLMRGAIAVESTPGEGSTFTVTLRRAPKPPAPLALPEQAGGDGCEDAYAEPG